MIRIPTVFLLPYSTKKKSDTYRPTNNKTDARRARCPRLFFLISVEASASLNSESESPRTKPTESEGRNFDSEVEDLDFVGALGLLPALSRVFLDVGVDSDESDSEVRFEYALLTEPDSQPSSALAPASSIDPDSHPSSSTSASGAAAVFLAFLGWRTDFGSSPSAGGRSSSIIFGWSRFLISSTAAVTSIARILELSILLCTLESGFGRVFLASVVEITLWTGSLEDSMRSFLSFVSSAVWAISSWSVRYSEDISTTIWYG